MTNTIHAQERIHYMDNLRALAMLAGVIFHAGLAYSVLVHGFWLTADVSRSVWVDVFAWFSHLFRMPLFFLLVGFFAALSVNRRGLGGMLRNRFKRIFLPFIVFWPILCAVMGWLVRYAVDKVENLSPLLIFIKEWMAKPNQPSVPPALMHLWFLPYVMCFCVLIWVAKALELKWISAHFVRLRAGALISLVPLVFVPPLLMVSAPFPAPESVFPQSWALVFFGLYFMFGYQLYHCQSMIDQCARFAPLLILASILGYAAFLYLIQSQNPLQITLSQKVIQTVLEAYVGFCMTLSCLIYGKRWLNGSNRIFRYFADTSYWVYLVHFPLLMAIQIELLDIHAAWQTKLIISIAATLGIAFLSYHLLVMHTKLGEFVGGGRQP